MQSFDTVNENHQHKFLRQDSKMLKNVFGSDELMSFWLADMDFPVAQPITEELQRLLNRGVYAYEFASKEVVESIVNWNAQRNNLALDSKAFLQVPGVLTGIALLIQNLTAPDDGIIIQTPVYHQFAQIIKKAGRKIIRNPLQIVNGRYEMDFDDLETKLKSKQAKVILLCNPHNPVGRVWERQELEQLTALANKYNVLIISDEIHSDIVYSGHRFTSIAAFQDDRHIALLGSPAKTFGMHSISNGYIYIPDTNTRKTIKNVVGSLYLDHGNALSTFATIAAYQYGGPWLDELLAYLEKNIAWIKTHLQETLPLVNMHPVEGTYQIWLDFSATQLSSQVIQQQLVEQAKVALTPGSWFDKDSALFMRMNIASPLSKIQKALTNVSAAFSEF